MSKASGCVTLLMGAGLAMCVAWSNTNTRTPIPVPRQTHGVSATLIMGNVSLATLRAGKLAEEHQGLPPTPSATIDLTQRPAEPAVRIAIVQPEPSAAPVQDREGLIRALQRELRRLGCYAGKVDAVWNVSTRVAVKAFTDRVNARLPNEPDHVLLALARNHQDKTCVQRCPEANGLTRGDRCPSSAILAQGSIRSGISTHAQAAVAGDSVTTTAVRTSPQSRPARHSASMWSHAPGARHRGFVQRVESNRVRRQHVDFATSLFARLQANFP